MPAFPRNDDDNDDNNNNNNNNYVKNEQTNETTGQLASLKPSKNMGR